MKAPEGKREGVERGMVSEARHEFQHTLASERVAGVRAERRRGTEKCI